MRAIDFDDPNYSKAQMQVRRDIAPPTDQEGDALLAVLRKKHAYQGVDLYAEPVYARSIAVELFIVEDWRNRFIRPGSF